MIVKKLTSQDLYKYFMQQVFFHKHSSATGEYVFKCRTKGIDFTPFIGQIETELRHVSTLVHNEYDIQKLREKGYFKEDYLHFLKSFQLDFSDLVFDRKNFEIRAKGYLHKTMMWEIFVLQIVNEVYFQQFDTVEAFKEGKMRLVEGLKTLPKGFTFAEFGVRRRFSYDYHHNVIRLIMKHEKEVGYNFIGTSCVEFSNEYGIKAIGTMAHEYLCAYQAFSPLHSFQKDALQDWADEYRGELGIALTDTVGTDSFLRDFDKYFSKLYDGGRHDSACPFEWGEKMNKHYESFGIDPMTKALVFSNGLDFKEGVEIFNHFKGKTNTSFGIGTFLTNNCGPKPLNIVMKLVTCNGQPVAKISDEPGKGMCEDEIYLAYLKQVTGITS